MAASSLAWVEASSCALTNLSRGFVEGDDMEINAEEVFLLFERWRAGDRHILCASSLFGWGLSLRGRVGVLSREEVSIVADGESGELSVHLQQPDICFTYVEPREVPPEIMGTLLESNRERSCLGVSLPLRVFPSALEGPLTIPEREKLFFIEDES
jgi:hypothetical protein